MVSISCRTLSQAHPLRPAAGFQITARCPDGVVEAIESTQEDWWALGTQFHPESESASALDVRIFEEFLDGVREKSRAVRLVA